MTIMDSRDIILIGGGGHCQSVIDVAENSGYRILGILDQPGKVGETILGYEVLGSDDDIASWADKAYFVITVGQIISPAIRIRIFNKIKVANGRLGTIIASDAHVSKHAVLGEGSVVLHKAIVNAGARIGSCCIVNTFADIEHGVHIGDFCHISTGARINGDVTIGDHSFIGSGAVVVNGISIIAKSIIGAASLVSKNIDESGVYAGVPTSLISKGETNNA